ncbi:acetyltransferase (GNAT) family protein [Saccharothrix saharensis]|uniref:Acetyltransferase (GNAT) family protein n=1 Tax=Saccharothrix saharensis TaxID=571190 RepID=A0A543JQG3_9PSEU|nr:GNAT family N-acetyltransferase [Saccharothrix saharensis]TQM85101.1 acetyltransferase (GNAT) family protein [Saccharothrix saharensis]
MGYAVREYAADDEPSWLRCRVLAFLGTAFYDDVVPAKPREPGVELVAVDGAVVVGILDLAVDGEHATIETIAVHPDHQHRGIGGALLSRARARARELGATTLDAWTRDDPPTLRWYRAMGFQESDHYLHVIADHRTSADEPARAVVARPGLRVAKAYLHADLADEARLRREFARVHVCRRFALPLRGELGRRGDHVDHRAVAQDGHRQG